MKHLFLVLSAFIFLLSCEKNDQFSNSTLDASIVGFNGEKCYCCWGWIIEIGEDTIRSEDIPGISYDPETTVFPINGTITIGKKLRECDSYTFDDDFYELIEFKL